MQTAPAIKKEQQGLYKAGGKRLIGSFLCLSTPKKKYLPKTQW
jgi:hypothetical protein